MSTHAQPQLQGIDPLQNRQFNVRKRDGRTAPFDPDRIRTAIEKAFRATLSIESHEQLSTDHQTQVSKVADAVVEATLSKNLQGDPLEVEGIQDEVETQLMKVGHYNVARRYIVYREERKKARQLRGDTPADAPVERQIEVVREDGSRVELDSELLRREIAIACKGLEDRCSAEDISEELLRMLYDGVTTEEISKARVLVAKSRVEKEPAYTYVAARLVLKNIYREALGKTYSAEELELGHRRHFRHYLEEGVVAELLSPKLLDFDIDRLASALRLERDRKLAYMGVQTLYDRYLQHIEGRRIETPQYFLMRVSMGLAMNEGEQKNERAIEFYNLYSSFRFMSSTPTLFNAGTLHPQLSSCYLSTVEDDLEHIFKLISDDARLSKWAGGLGNDWTPIRATGSHIKGTNGTSQGVIPFLKVANDTAVAVNQGGKRKGAMCAYLETWHLDLEDFLDLRKNTGDDRRRTHDMNTANWIPDLFMKRVAAEGQWTLFSPNDVPDLHDLYGAAFKERYEEYEAMAERGEIKLSKKVEAVDLWRKMLSMLFETGHPWITFKDPSNVRSPQDHTGVVHSSNLCTEILLNTSKDETAVCNLGSVNLAAHVTADGKLNEKMLGQTIRTAMRMLDNVIDINYYPTPEARNANLRHRPVGLGLMGFQDALYKANITWTSQEAIDFADRSMEMISYYAILSSTELAQEKGTYETYEGSKWQRGLLPIDTVELLEQERGSEFTKMDKSQSMDWDIVRERISQFGMRNSNTMAIAPTATIANITGVNQSIEPMYKHLYTKSNLSGEFTVLNEFLVEDLKSHDLWDDEMLDDLKYYDGNIDEIERIPEDLKAKYLTAFELDSRWLIECASRRQKWIDMGQSLNLYIHEPSGRKLHEMYMFAWLKGLKTTYYLRSLAATHIEKSTIDVNRRGLQPRWMKNKSASSAIQVEREAAPAPQQKVCSILDPDCDACQ